MPPEMLLGVGWRSRECVIVGLIESLSNSYPVNFPGSARDGGEQRRQAEWVKTIVLKMDAPDREILTRFHFLEQSPERICRELSLTETQFRLLESRARSRFGRLAEQGPVPTPSGESSLSRKISVTFDLDQLLPIVAHAVAVFGDEVKAAHWLTTPLPLFANQSPATLLADEAGLERVEQTLTRIEHNIPS